MAERPAPWIHATWLAAFAECEQRHLRGARTVDPAGARAGQDIHAERHRIEVERQSRRDGESGN